jgi:hypothetical protein
MQFSTGRRSVSQAAPRCSSFFRWLYTEGCSTQVSPQRLIFREHRDAFTVDAASLDERYEQGRRLGSGGFAVVTMATDLSDGSQWACKSINKHRTCRTQQSRDLRRTEVMAAS